MRAIALLVFAAALAAGCGDDNDPEPAAAPSTTTEATSLPGLPPLESLTEDNLAGLQEVYGPALAALDLVITRGGVTEYRGGNHLALYVVPTGDAADDGPAGYLHRMLPSFNAIRPLLFDAYPALDSFDLCQEPVPDPAAPLPEGTFPPASTFLLLSREGYDSVDDWDDADLADLIAAADADLGGYLDVLPEIESLPEYPGAG